MKLARADVVASFRKIPEVRFEDPATTTMTSYAGLVVFQRLFADLNLRTRLQECFFSQSISPMIGFNRLALWWILHISQKDRGTTEKRTQNWAFEKLSTIRQKIIQRAARLIRPQGKLTLVMAADGDLQEQVNRYLQTAA